MEENKTIDSNVEVEGGATEAKNNEVQAKSYTEEEFQEKLEKVLNKKFAQWKKKEEEAKEEATKLASMNAEQKAKHEIEVQRKELEEMKLAFESEKLLNETTNQLASKNLPTEFASILKGVDAETTFENIKVFEEKFNNALEKAVTERFKGKTPTVSTAEVSNQASKEEFRKMTMAQRLRLRNEDPKRYIELSEQ